MVTRMYSSISKVFRVCIVGAGPAGFYAAMHITKHLPSVHVDILEKLPVPFGLIRYGVAPDHPEVKNVIHQFTKVAKQENVSFYGNVTLGKDVSLSQLRRHYDAVLLTYGAEEDKTLGIENEDANNVIAARHFVGWYNGLPSDKNLKIDLSGSTAAVLGQGNVALDVARILLTPIDELKKTDITDYALNALAESKVKEIYLVGRRGPLHVAFTIRELREQLKLKNSKTVWRESDFDGVSEVVNELARPRKRLTELMLKSLQNASEHKENSCVYFKPIFYRGPNKLLADNHNHVTGVELTCNRLVGDKLENQKSVPTDEKELLNCSLVLRSIGYKSVIEDKDLRDCHDGHLKNDRGQVMLNDCEDAAKVYVAGWLGTGPVGVIIHTMGNAFQVAKSICEDIRNSDSQNVKGGFKDVEQVILNKTEVVDWRGWEKIDEYEVEQGKRKGKPREKVCDIDKMIEIAKS